MTPQTCRQIGGTHTLTYGGYVLHSPTCRTIQHASTSVQPQLRAGVKYMKYILITLPHIVNAGHGMQCLYLLVVLLLQ